MTIPEQPMWSNSTQSRSGGPHQGGAAHQAGHHELIGPSDRQILFNRARWVLMGIILVVVVCIAFSVGGCNSSGPSPSPTVPTSSTPSPSPIPGYGLSPGDTGYCASMVPETDCCDCGGGRAKDSCVWKHEFADKKIAGNFDYTSMDCFVACQVLGRFGKATEFCTPHDDIKKCQAATKSMQDALDASPGWCPAVGPAAMDLVDDTLELSPLKLAVDNLTSALAESQANIDTCRNTISNAAATTDARSVSPLSLNLQPGMPGYCDSRVPHADCCDCGGSSATSKCQWSHRYEKGKQNYTLQSDFTYDVKNAPDCSEACTVLASVGRAQEYCTLAGNPALQKCPQARLHFEKALNQTHWCDKVVIPTETSVQRLSLKLAGLQKEEAHACLKITQDITTATTSIRPFHAERRVLLGIAVLSGILGVAGVVIYKVARQSASRRFKEPLLDAC